jgi:raffinose/stachyose/melibiose transport system substrate-binding protein
MTLAATWKRMMRVALAVAVVAGATGSTAACSPSTSDDQAGSTRLTVWSWRTEDVAAYNKIFAEFTRQHPEITVEFKAYKNTEYNTILQTGLSESGGPDVAQLRTYGQLQPFVESGGLLPLDGKVDLSGFQPAVLASAKGKKDGKLYGVPAAVQTMQVFYNKKIFADQGLSVPTTWPGLIAAAQKLQAAGVTPFATTGKDSWMLPILHDTFAATRYGGSQFEARLLAGKTKFTDPAYVASLQVVKSLQPYLPKDVVGVSYTDSQLLFLNEKAAMFPGGSFELGFFTKQNPDLQVGTFAAPPPPGAVLGAPVTPGWADMSFGVNAKSPHQQEALELVSWMASKDFGQRFTDELKQISPVPGVSASDPLLAEMRRAYDRSPAPYLLLVDFRYGQPTGTDLMGEGIQQLLLGKTDAAGVAGSVQKGISQWFKPSGG